MTKTENAVIKYQVDFEKYKNGQANAIIELLDNASSEIAKYIKKTTGVYTKARYKEIAKKLKEISAKLKENAESGIDVDGVIDYELKKQSKILGTLKNDIMKVKDVGEVNFLYPSVEQIKTAALFKPIIDGGYGMTWQSYLDGIESGFYNTWDVGVRTGYLTGQTTAQIVRSVMGGVSKIDKLANPGSITSLRNSVYANTRTALQALANETQRRVYEENEKYFAKNDRYEYLATLDSRTCLVCGALDGRTFNNLNDERFQLPKHRGCVLGDTLISSVDGISKVYRRRYKGLIYRIRTASGNVLSVTPNHPILTDKGFVRAHLLNIGDNVISDNGLETVSIVGKNENNRQVLIKDIFRSFRKSPFMFSCTVPVAAEDFHGDAVYNKVNVISTDGKLRSKRNVFRLQNFFKDFFINRSRSVCVKSESKKSRLFQIFFCHFSAFCRFMGSLCKMCNLFWRRVFHSFKLLFVRISHSNIISSEETNHLSSSKSKPLCDTSNSNSLIVNLKNFINTKIIGRVSPSSADISPMKNISDDVFGNTELAGNILNGYSAQIKADSIVAIDIIKKKFCHVYNLETKNNWYIANGIITHNCRCVIVPHFDIKGDTRASKGGQVDAKIGFGDWLKEQDEKTQLDVLGRTRYELFKKGGKIEQFVDGGKVLTLDELKKRLKIENKPKSSNVDLSIENPKRIDDKLFDELKEKFKTKNIVLADEMKESDKDGLVRLNAYLDKADVKNEITSIKFNSPLETGGMNMHFDGTLSLSRKSFSDIKSYEERISDAAKNHIVPKNSTLESFFEHEIKGHGAERLLILKRYGSGLQNFNKGQIAWNNDELATEICKTAWESVKNHYQKIGINDIITASRRISDEAASDFSECMADSVADVFANKNNAEMFSKAIVNVISKWL